MNIDRTTAKVTKVLLKRQFDKGDKKWTSLVHNGVIFADPYIPINVPVYFQGKPVNLDPDSEEVATFYAKLINGDQVKNPTFNKNFWNDWKKYLGSNHVITNLEECDFTAMYDHLQKTKEEKSQDTETKEKIKEMEKEFKVAYLDGAEQHVGNIKLEPPGIFMGRGNNPKMGRLKKRIYPEDITINLSEVADIPTLPDFLKDHKWGNIVHNHYVEWLASWGDEITGKTKYVWLNNNSKLKAKSDIEKFELARQLKTKIKKIRLENNKNLTDPDPFYRQISTAIYFIDNFALRVGNEKGDDEADTVGVTSLRVEHIKIDGDNITLDFLGKDSVRYKKTVRVSQVVSDNLKEFIDNKRGDDDIFNLITSSHINKYLKNFMPNLTAKVFRTYNASNLFQEELDKISRKYQDYKGNNKSEMLLAEYNAANITVAKLCNHQKNVGKSSNKQVENIDNNIKKLKKKLKELERDKEVLTTDTQTETPTASQEKKIITLKSKITKTKDKLQILQAKKKLKIELKDISITTSRVNYLDPRITVAFLKKHDLDLSKIFSKTLMEKFKWSFDVDENYVF